MTPTEPMEVSTSKDWITIHEVSALLDMDRRAAQIRMVKENVAYQEVGQRKLYDAKRVRKLMDGMNSRKINNIVMADTTFDILVKMFRKYTTKNKVLSEEASDDDIWAEVVLRVVATIDDGDELSQKGRETLAIAQRWINEVLKASEQKETN